jgi:hypothetical protein
MPIPILVFGTRKNLQQCPAREMLRTIKSAAARRSRGFCIGMVLVANLIGCASPIQPSPRPAAAYELTIRGSSTCKDTTLYGGPYVIALSAPDSSNGMMTFHLVQSPDWGTAPERERLRVNDAFLRQFPIAGEASGYRLYRVRPEQRAGAPPTDRRASLAGEARK